MTVREPCPDTGLVVGLGARPGVCEAAVRAAVRALLARYASPNPPPILAYATLDARSGEPGLRAAVDGELLAYPAWVLASVAVPNPSAVAQRAVGTPSVAEAAAVHAARVLAPAHGVVDLVGEKLVGQGVTAALAKIRVLG